MKIAELSAYLQDLGAKPEHQARFFRAWLQRRSLDNRRSKAEHHLPLRLREALPALMTQLEELARLRSQHPGEDGSLRLWVGLSDGQSVESVLLPRDGLCVSTQVGCAVGCRFCMTGQSGLLRQLDSSEILAQVVLARGMRPVNRVVFMGMGEPAHNLDNVVDAIQRLGTEGAIGHKNLVFSTVGDLRVFERLPTLSVKPALAISLHSTRAELRRTLMPQLPRTPELSPEELVERAEQYARQTGYPIQYQWTLLEGVNDDEEEMAGIVRLLGGKYAMMNLIPYNANDGLPYRRPTAERIAALTEFLNRHRILTKVRQSAGQDVEGGCGQLRARSEKVRRIHALPSASAPLPTPPNTTRTVS